MLKKLLPLLFTVINLHAGWSFPPLPVSDRAEADTTPHLCCNNAGQAFAIWLEQGPSISTFNIQVSVFQDESWSPEQTISQIPTTSPNAGSYDICCDDSGRAIAIWSSHVGTQFSILVSHYNGTSWGVPIPLEPASTSSRDVPLICCDNSGRAIAIWDEASPVQNKVRTAFFNGSTWNVNPTPISGFLTSVATALCCHEMNGSLHAFAAWASSNLIQVSQFDGTNWSTPINVSATTSRTPSICCDEQGHAFVAWNHASAVVVEASYFNGSTWSSPTPLSVSSETVAIPFVKVCCHNNTANAVWLGKRGILFEMRASHFDGVSWSPTGTNAFILSGNVSGAVTNVPSICCDALGGAVSVWVQPDAGVNVIYASTYNGATWSLAERISVAGIPSSTSEVCCNDLGNAVAIWVASGTVLRIESAFYTNLLPVTNFRACSFVNRTATQSATSVILSWTATINPLIPAYRIYRNGVLIATIPASVTSYKNCLINPCETNTYSIVTIDVMGNESSPTTIVL